MITELASPQIGERVFDPSLGTAGFLVSAYTHMLQPYTEEDGQLGANLTDNNLWDKLSNDTFFGNDSCFNFLGYYNFDTSDEVKQLFQIYIEDIKNSEQPSNKRNTILFCKS